MELLELGSENLVYQTNQNKYIVTFAENNISDIDKSIINRNLDRIFNSIFPLYNSNKILYKNVCGQNAEFICKNVKINGVKFGKIIITDWIREDRNLLEKIQSVYGKNGLSIGGSYHALVYVELTENDKLFYIAIETTICEPYKLQFYVGTDINDFKNLLKIRYMCNDLKISYDCQKYWMDIAYGGKTVRRRKRYKKTRKNKNKNKKNNTKRNRRNI